MKKIISLLILALLVFSLCSCTIVAAAEGESFEAKITFDTLSLYADVNTAQVENFKDNIKGIVLQFHGISDFSQTGDSDFAWRCKRHNAIYVFPNGGPWNWMNETTVRMTDRIIDVLIEHYGLSKDIPVISTGHSMGGAGALVYAAYSKHNIVGVATNSAVCDLFAQADYNPSFWRTYVHAVGDYSCSFDDAVKSVSPVNLIDKMPNVPYFMVHGTADTDVQPQTNSDVMAALLKDKGYNVTYERVEDMTHVAMPTETKTKYFEFLYQILDK